MSDEALIINESKDIGLRASSVGKQFFSLEISFDGQIFMNLKQTEELRDFLNKHLDKYNDE